MAFRFITLTRQKWTRINSHLSDRRACFRTRWQLRGLFVRRIKAALCSRVEWFRNWSEINRINRNCIKSQCGNPRYRRDSRTIYWAVLVYIAMEREKNSARIKLRDSKEREKIVSRGRSNYRKSYFKGLVLQPSLSLFTSSERLNCRERSGWIWIDGILQGRNLFQRYFTC